MEVNPDGWGQLGSQDPPAVTPRNLMPQLDQVATNSGAGVQPQQFQFFPTGGAHTQPPAFPPPVEEFINPSPFQQSIQAGIFSALASLGRAISSQLANLGGFGSSQTPVPVAQPGPNPASAPPSAPPPPQIPSLPPQPQAYYPGVPQPVPYQVPTATFAAPPSIPHQSGTTQAGHPIHTPTSHPNNPYPTTYCPMPNLNHPSSFGPPPNYTYQSHPYPSPQQDYGMPFPGSSEQFGFGISLQSKYGQLAFSQAIINEPFPPNFQAPKQKDYYGDADPDTHITEFQDLLVSYTISDAVRCRLFLQTLKKGAREWFTNLPPNSIFCFDQLLTQFLSHFSSSRKPIRSTDVLMAVRQEPGETLRQYVQRFREEMRQVTGLKSDVAMASLKMGLRDSQLKHSLGVLPAKNMDDLLNRAWVYINAEEEAAASSSIFKAVEPARSYPPRTDNRDHSVPRSHIKQNPDKGKEPARSDFKRKDSEGRAAQKIYSINTADLGLGVTLTAVVSAIQGKPFFKKPEAMRASAANRDRSKFCLYHEDHGHDTNDCRFLKHFLLKLIKEGYLREFMAKEDSQHQPKRQKGAEAGAVSNIPPPLNITGDLNSISGGLRPSANHRSSLTCFNQGIIASAELFSTAPITFSDEDLPPYPNPHRDALVIQVVVNSLKIHRVLIDGGSSVDVIFSPLLAPLGILIKNLRPVVGELVDFGGGRWCPEGAISLTVSVQSTADPGLYIQTEVDFVVINAKSAYNMILGRNFIEDSRAVASTRHMSIKFPAPFGIMTTRGDQVQARKAYINTMKVGASDLLPVPTGPQITGAVKRVLVPASEDGRYI